VTLGLVHLVSERWGQWGR